MPSYCFTRSRKSPISSCVSSSQRDADVALRVRRAFLELAELVAIALGRTDVPAALDDEQLRRLAGRVEAVAVQDAAMDDEVVALAERQIAEHRLERPLALRDVHHLVRLRVAVEVLVLLVRLDVRASRCPD